MTDPIAPIGLIAGEGSLPIEIAAHLTRQGKQVSIIRLDGLAAQDLQDYPGIDLNIGHMGRAMDWLKDQACTEVIFAGYIHRLDFSKLDLDAYGQSVLPRIITAATDGDDALMRAVIQIFQDEGFNVQGAETLYEALLCPAGVLTAQRPTTEDKADLDRALHIARLMGAEDIGQGCVVCAGLVLAVEAQEGTDHMLHRITELPLTVRGTLSHRRGVLVKCAKPDQERRVDLPVIGPETIAKASAAGLCGIGLEAGSSLILDREATIEAANQAGLFIIGLEASASPSSDMS